MNTYVSMRKPKITYDAHGTPAVWADNVVGAYWGMGFLHGRHRALQSLLFGGAARGLLAARLLPKHDLLLLDALVHRLDLPGKALEQERLLDEVTTARLDHYLAGFDAALTSRGTPWELRLLRAKLPPLDRQSVLAGLMLSAFLGLAEGQEHMERALVDCLHAGGKPDFLRTMFAPHLDGWDEALLSDISREVDMGFAAYAIRAAGGSNAWAVGAQRTRSGRPVLCGDPHLQINQLPSLFFEARFRIGEDYWLGATLPGLPGLAVGRNRRVAWSGTFACADNVDMTVEHLRNGTIVRPEGAFKPHIRHYVQRRRGLPSVHRQFWSSDQGTLQHLHHGVGTTLAVRWSGPDDAAQALGAYMQLPLAHSAQDAATILQQANTLSLHFVIADCTGDLRYQQAGRIPRRTGGWSGLYPTDRASAQRWDGVFGGAELPHGGPEDGVIVSANETRPGLGGAVLSTLSPAPYRYHRIKSVLLASHAHDLQSMQSLQQDLVSLQGLALRPWLLRHIPPGPHATALAAWDGVCDAESVGAHAFALAYSAALEGLETALGGAWWRRMLARSEIRVWWSRGLDRVLQDPATWAAPVGQSMQAALAKVTQQALQPWGDVRTLRFKHLIYGGLPDVLRLNRGPYPMVGSLATVQQGTVIPSAAGDVAVGPAYRMVCDFSDEGLHTSIPGGIDGHFGASTYDCWIDEWRAGGYHRLMPPTEEEGERPR